jgi:hypothetical protein
MVYNELKTRYKIKKFLRRLENYFYNAYNNYNNHNTLPSFGFINNKINELIKYLDRGYNIKFNNNIDDFYYSDIEYDIFYYFIVNNKFNYKLIDCKVY